MYMVLYDHDIENTVRMSANQKLGSSEAIQVPVEHGCELLSERVYSLPIAIQLRKRETG